jgi:hypothetical protein
MRRASAMPPVHERPVACSFHHEAGEITRRMLARILLISLRRIRLIALFHYTLGVLACLRE